MHRAPDRNGLVSRLAGTAACAYLLLLAPRAEAAIVQRPIEDFLAAQGTFCFPDGAGGCALFVPPVTNYVGSGDTARARCASLDYAGLAADWLEAASGGAVSLGTTTSGTVEERALPDGRAEVKVVLHTSSALLWVVDGCDYAAGTELFGHRPTEVLAGAAPSLAEATTAWLFYNVAPMAPLPDLMQLAFVPAPGQELRGVSIRAFSIGELQAGFGVPDGTPGEALIRQRGIATGNEGIDSFPAEDILLKMLP